MFKNYFLISLRNIRNYGFYSVINVLGLSIGLAAAILIIPFLQHELSADKHHENYNNTYRIGIELGIGGPAVTAAVSSYPIGPELKENFPEIKEFTRFYSMHFFTPDLLIEFEEKSFYESGVLLVDSNFFDFFTHPVIYGDPADCLRHKNLAILTRSSAQKIFGEGDPVGKTFVIDNQFNIQVGAVIEDIPDNSHLKFRVLLSWYSMDEAIGRHMASDTYFQNNLFTYVKVDDNFDLSAFEPKLDNFIRERTVSSFEENNIKGVFNLYMRPMSELYFLKTEQYEPSNPEVIPAKGDKSYVYVFIAIAVFLTVIASINYMNMAIARSARRSKEVGVRKVLGASQKSLIRQFLSESLLISFIALVVALFWVEISLPWFNQMLMKNLSISVFQNPVLLMAIPGLTLLVGLISGSYPAFYLSRFQPLKVLKKQVNLSDRNLSLRKVLVGLQFTISIFMITTTLVVLGQLFYMRNKELGYQKDNILIFNITDLGLQHRNTLKNEVDQLPVINQASLSHNIPGPGRIVSNNGILAQTPEGFAEHMVGIYHADPSFLKLYDIELSQGRFFDMDLPTDRANSIVINQAAARLFEWEEPLGKQIKDNSGQDTIFRRVIGVVNDFHVHSMDLEIGALVIYPTDNGTYLSVSFEQENATAALNSVEGVWNEVAGNLPLRYDFLDENHRMAYLIHTNQGQLFALFALLCIFLSLMGLFGLSGFSAEQKTKEIGIRKVHGATLGNILVLLYREYVVLMLIAGVIASVAAWFIMDHWLAQFAFNTGLRPAPFILASLLALSVSLLTVGYHAMRSSGANPVQALKYE